ncbi:MAG: hypothetical protein EPO40_29600 [Myxococcaceae bacterium]|nr:MAG: hypothetical protein EPO40_29600 [Myxococcaceae bacterium]
MSSLASPFAFGALVAAEILLAAAVSEAQTQAPTQFHSIALSGASGLSLGSSGGGNSYATHTPVYVDVAWRTWHSTTPQWVTGFSLRAEVDGRTSVGVVPRFEFSRSVGRLTLRPGVAAAIFFAPYVLAGPEASVTFDLRLGSVVSLIGALSVDVFFLGNDVPARSVLFATNGALGVAIHL